jgi:septal ring factor EnvC (AmiA/AmiB activator)
MKDQPMRLATILAALFFASPALAQTAPAGSQAIQRQQPPTLQQSIDGAIAGVTRTVTGLGDTIATLANQTDTLRQQLAEANQTLATANAKVADLTKQIAGQTTGKVEATEPTKKE